MKQAYILNISDNVKHKDLSDYELALRLSFLREEMGFEIEDLAQLIDKKSVTVYNLLRLTKIDSDLQMAVHHGKIGVSHALEIARCPDFKRLKIFEQTIRNDLSVRAIKQIKENILGRERLTYIAVKWDKRISKGDEGLGFGYEAYYRNYIKRCHPGLKKNMAVNTQSPLWRRSETSPAPTTLNG